MSYLCLLLCIKCGRMTACPRTRSATLFTTSILRRSVPGWMLSPPSRGRGLRRAICTGYFRATCRPGLMRSVAATCGRCTISCIRSTATMTSGRIWWKYGFPCTSKNCGQMAPCRRFWVKSAPSSRKSWSSICAGRFTWGIWSSGRFHICIALSWRTGMTLCWLACSKVCPGAC